MPASLATPTSPDHVRDFLSHGRYIRNWSPRTVRTYAQSLATLTEALGVAPCPDHLSSQTMSAFVVWMRQRGLTPGGCNVRIRSVNSFLSWLHEDGRSETRLRVRLLPRSVSVLTTFSDAEVKRLATYRPVGRVQQRTWALVMLLFDTGLRIDEALRLERSRIDFEALTAVVRGKGDRERMVPMSPIGRRAVYQWSAKQRGELLFSSFKGDRLQYRNARRDFLALCACAGVRGPHVRFHNIRHYFAVSYLRNGGDLYRLSRILGHADIGTTQTYLRSMSLGHLHEGHAKHSPLGRLL